ncbi:MAG: GIY-YIG nuclease family protein [Lachnospiraceae bacterium]|nr:GIY-YIG nuclease family protein [Lachnospiraceae bacterium]
MHYTYMVKCGDGTLYTGYTTDVLRRTKEHNRGKGARYTRSRLPVELVYYELHDTKTDAMRREYDLKQLTRVEKLKLIEEFHRGEKKE